MNNAKIIIKSKEEGETSEITYFGRAWKSDSIQYFEYTEIEQSQNPELKVTFSLDGKSFTMTRSGEMLMTMNFDESKLSQFSIKTEIGVLDVVLHTHRLKVDNFENKSEIDIEYELSFTNGEKFLHNVNILLTHII